MTLYFINQIKWISTILMHKTIGYFHEQKYDKIKILTTNMGNPQPCCFMQAFN